MKNEPVSSISHLVGGLVSIAGLVLMLVAAVRYGTAWHIVSYAIFGSSLILLYFSSSLYHIVFHDTRWKKRFQKLDHSMIFVLIAGTYTPMALVPLRGGWGWSIFGVTWGIAVIGVLIEVLGIKIKKWQSISLYILMGWIVMIAIKPLLDSISKEALLWLAIGGGCYTLGAGFYALDKIFKKRVHFGWHEIFHFLVIAGSFCHFWLMYKYIVFVN